MSSTALVGDQPVLQSLSLPYLAAPGQLASHDTHHLASFAFSATQFIAPLSNNSNDYALPWFIPLFYGLPLWFAACKPQINPVNTQAQLGAGSGSISI